MASLPAHPPHANETVIAVMPGSPTIADKTPSIKRHVQLYRYGKSGLLGKKAWKEGNVIIYDDSTFKIFKDAEGHKTSIKPIKLEDVALDLAFGKAASKYGAPPIVGDEHNFIAPNNFIAVPETKEKNKIHWFAAKDEHGLNEIMQVIADTLAGKMKPPQLGKGPKGRYFNQDENEKWVTYWHAQQHAAEPNDENGEQKTASTTHPMAKPVVIPSPPVSATDKNQKHGKQPQVAFVQMPSKIEVLRLEADRNLRDESHSDTVPVVRLVKGQRVKENVVKTPPSQTTPPPKFATPTSVPIHHQDYKNGRHSASPRQSGDRSPVPRYEISTYVVGEPETTTTNIAISAPVKEHFTQHQQHEEVMDGNQKTVISVEGTERTFAAVDNTTNGVTYTSSKQSSYHRSTVVTSTE